MTIYESAKLADIEKTKARVANSDDPNEIIFATFIPAEHNGAKVTYLDFERALVERVKVSVENED